RSKGCGLHSEVKPSLKWKIKANAVHVIVNGLSQSCCVLLMCSSCRVGMRYVIVCKATCCGTQRHDLKGFRLHPYWTMRCHGKLMPKSGVYNLGFKHLAHYFQAVYGFLLGLSRKAIHQIGMHHNTCLGKVATYLCYLCYTYTFFDEFQ